MRGKKLGEALLNGDAVDRSTSMRIGLFSPSITYASLVCFQLWKKQKRRYELDVAISGTYVPFKAMEIVWRDLHPNHPFLQSSISKQAPVFRLLDSELDDATNE